MRPFAKKLLKLSLIPLALFVLLVGVIAVRTAMFRSRQVDAKPAAKDPIDTAAVAAHLSGAIKFKTISYQDHTKFDTAEFAGLIKYLETTYPHVFSQLERETINEFTQLLKWTGSDPSLKPALLMGHLDVVPIEPGTESKWEQPPFSGAIEGGFIWGRGSLDDKVTALGVLEAVERLLAAGVKPRRTIYLQFGHDEEVSGFQGAAKAAELLAKRGVQLDYVIDEGLVIMQGIVPGVKPQVALIGVSEKGYVTVELIAHGKSGHSSMPPKENAVAILAAAIGKIEASPMPGKLEGPIREMFESVGPEMDLAKRAIFANLWLFGGLVSHELAAKPETNAALSTTSAATIIEGGVKENVVPASARAMVNFRIRPGDTVQGVLDHVKRVVADERIEIRPSQEGKPSDPSPVSSTGAESYKALERTVREVFPGVLVAPSVMIGASDSRHYSPICENIYRFCPMWFGPGDLTRLHGTNERLPVENFPEIIRFYEQLIRNTAM